MVTPPTYFVFVYGASRRGQSLSSATKGRFVGAATVKGYWLYELSIVGRSYALPSRGDRPAPAPLSGELYELDGVDLLEMDQFHDVASGLYERVPVEAYLENGETVSAWIYEGAKIAPTRVESGDWEHRGVDCGKA